jgi:hypothetical protein
MTTITSEADAPGKPAIRVYTIPDAGAMAGLSRNASYGAAKRKEMPTIRFGRRLKVPAELWDRMLSGQSAA